MINTAAIYLIFEMMSGTNIHNRFYALAFRLLFIQLTVMLVACHTKKEDRLVERSFYYWKSVLKLSDNEQQRLADLRIKTLYLKFFDVGWNEVTHSAVPIAPLQTAAYKLPDSMTIIPVVFITNECIQKIDSAAVGNLAVKIYSLIKEIKNANHWQNAKNIDGTHEIQIDCDWTATTKSKYFKLLEILGQQHNQDDDRYPNSISCTIRLHQIKYLLKTGVPPVQKGLLMCYNMGNLKNPATKNSIIETEELKKYIGSLSSYPLPLDVALPLFDWKVLFRNNIYTGLIEDLPDSAFKSSFALQTDNRIALLKDTLLQGYVLQKGDIIRIEKSNYNEVLSAAGEISQQLKNTALRVSLYHLDSLILNKYSLNEMESIYNSLH